MAFVYFVDEFIESCPIFAFQGSDAFNILFNVVRDRRIPIDRLGQSSHLLGRMIVIGEDRSTCPDINTESS